MLDGKGKQYFPMTYSSRENFIIPAQALQERSTCPYQVLKIGRKLTFVSCLPGAGHLARPFFNADGRDSSFGILVPALLDGIFE